MKVLIIGSGGREHALAYQIAKSNHVTEVFVAPGNAGTALEAKVENIAIDATDITALCQYAKQQAIDLTIVGPEAPLALGIVDAFQQADLACFGPSQKAAQLESSKAFSKNFMQQHDIPTAAYATFTDVKTAHDYVDLQTPPVVIKASGLAAGKGVIIATTLSQAHQAVDAIMQDRQFGDAGVELVIEEFLQGTELSFMVITDGETVLPLATSKDHKRRDDNDLGPNTGGMGAYSPSPLINDDLHDRIMKSVIHPTLNGLKASGITYTGFLYAGLMIDEHGGIQVLEFNCRMGDPETQPILLKLKSNLAQHLSAACQGQLKNEKLEWHDQVALGVVMASGGYPEHYEKGHIISGLDDIPGSVKAFHAGTKQQDNNIVTNGGRVLCICALGDNLSQAADHVYQHIDTINWPSSFYRKDIGKDIKA